MSNLACNRRAFIQRSLALAAGTPLAFQFGAGLAADTPDVPPKASASPNRAIAKVAIVSCRSYGPEVRAALKQSFDLVGGIGSLVKNKTVTVKLNLTGTNFSQFLNRPVGETYMTHFATAAALGSLLFDAGAKRVRFVESTQSKSDLERTLSLAD